MSVSMDRMERVLRQGLDQVAPLVDELPAGKLRERAVAVRDLIDVMLWCEASHGGVIARHDGVDSRVWLVMLPDNQMHLLKAGNTFQTSVDGDGTIHINVHAVPFTPLWAGLGLVHELSHAYDYYSGIEPIHPSQDEMARGEIRAFLLEMALLDRLTAGRLTTALSDPASRPQFNPDDYSSNSDKELIYRVESQTIGPGALPPKSTDEINLRGGLFMAATFLANCWRTADPTQVVDPEHVSDLAGSILLQAAE